MRTLNNSILRQPHPQPPLHCGQSPAFPRPGKGGAGRSLSLISFRLSLGTTGSPVLFLVELLVSHGVGGAPEGLCGPRLGLSSALASTFNPESFFVRVIFQITLKMPSVDREERSLGVSAPLSRRCSAWGSHESFPAPPTTILATTPPHPSPELPVFFVQLPKKST